MNPHATTTENLGASPTRQTPDASHSGCRVLRGFVVGQENRLVAWAIDRCLQDEPANFSPLVLFGESGVGKSHLLRALIQEWNELDLGPVVSLTAAEFAREVASAIEEGDLEPLRERFLLAQLVVIEDLHRLEQKAAAQRELVSLLDSFEATGCQFVATAPMPARELHGLSDPLRDRLSAGLIVRVSRPSVTTRAEIVRRLAIQRDICLSPEAILLVAREVEGTAQDLLRTLLEISTSLDSRLDDEQSPQLNESAIRVDQPNPLIDEARVRHCLDRRSETSRLTLRQLCAATARYFSLTQAVLKSSKRSQAVATARGVAMYVARQQTTESLKSIGQFFGGRDHTTVLHNCRKIEQLLDSDPDIRLAVETIAAIAVNVH